MLDDGCGILDAGESGDVVKGGIVSECTGRGRGQEGQIAVAECHGRAISAVYEVDAVVVSIVVGERGGEGEAGCLWPRWRSKWG